MRLFLFALLLVAASPAAVFAASLRDFGAVCDGAHMAEDSTAFARAMRAAPKILYTRGRCDFDNTAVITIKGYGGTLAGDGAGSTWVFHTLTKEGMQFEGSTGLRFEHLAFAYAGTPAKRGPLKGILNVADSSFVTFTDVKFSNAPDSGLTLERDRNVTIQNMKCTGGLLANCLFSVNTAHLRVDGLESRGSQDAAAEFSQYDGQAGICDDVILTHLHSSHDYLGILVNACTRVTADTGLIEDTFIDGIDITQSETTTNKRHEDNVQIRNINILRTGSSNPGNSAVRAIRVFKSDTRPTAPIRIQLSRILVDSGNAGAVCVLVEDDPYFAITLTDIQVKNCRSTAFDLAGGSITARRLTSAHSQGFGMVLRGKLDFNGFDLKFHDSQMAGADTRAFLNNSTGRVFVSGPSVTSDQAVFRDGVDDQARTGTHVFSGVTFSARDGAKQAVTNGAGNPGFSVR